MEFKNFHLPSNDLMFKHLFATDDGAKERFKILICEILRINPADIEELTILNPEIPAEDLQKRSIRLDVKALMKLYGESEFLNIEIQRVVHSNIFDRALFHWARLHQESLLKNEQFSKIRKTISIWLLSGNIDNSERSHRTARVMDIATHEEISDKLELHFIELSKVDFSNISEKDTGKMFLKLLAINSKEELDMLENTTSLTPEMEDLVIRIKAFNKDKEAYNMLLQRQEELLFEYEEHQLRLEKATAVREKATAEREKAMAEREKATAERERTIAETIALFVTEFYKTAINLPEYVKKETNGTCTPFDFFKIMVRDTITTLTDFSYNLAGYIGKLVEFGVPFSVIAEKVNANPDDVQEFYNKFNTQKAI